MRRFIHLLYVPTMNCNMQCRYCYLGENTSELKCDKGYLETLNFAVNKLREADVIPYNISLHGGEVTTLSKEDFRDIVAYISNYYNENRELLDEYGFKSSRPHIKTNLYNLQRHIDAIRDYDVSISGSLDLPLALHDKYRVTKGGEGTLQTILRNVELLGKLPNRKKVSSTIFQEHFEYLDDIVKDIKYLADNTCLDMNDFNFMIGFEPQTEAEVKLTALSEDNQLKLYERMKKEFKGTPLEQGLNEAWFAEFTPNYCSASDNCGEKFFLLEKNGDIYSCVRGQGHKDFYYGNIYTDSVERIMGVAVEKIFLAHNETTITEECVNCEYLHLCRTGCPFVKKVYGTSKSYTCKLQRKMYEDMGYMHKPPQFTHRFMTKMHPMESHIVPKPEPEKNSLEDLIAKDAKLQLVYASGAFILSVDGKEIPLESQLTKTDRNYIFITEKTTIKIYVKKETMDWLSDYPVNNALYVMLLSGDMVVYGDEQREKQEHIMTHMVFKSTLMSEPCDKEGYCCMDLTALLALYKDKLSKVKANNLFFTTTALRDYHYKKHLNNAYYHINAMNLPFQNIEFYYPDADNT